MGLTCRACDILHAQVDVPRDVKQLALAFTHLNAAASSLGQGAGSAGMQGGQLAVPDDEKVPSTLVAGLQVCAEAF